MGIEELLLVQARHEGEARGEARGIKSKERSVVQSLIRDTDFDDSKIASLATVTISFVKKVRAQMGAVHL